MQKSYLSGLRLEGRCEFKLNGLYVADYPHSASDQCEPKDPGAHLISVRDEVKS